MSSSERKVACTDWVLHSSAAQAVCAAKIHDGCLMRTLIEKVKVREPSEGSTDLSGALDNTPSQQETNPPSALEREENEELAGLRNQPRPQSEAPASDSDFEALELEKQRKEEEGEAKTSARKRAAEDTRVEEEAKNMIREGSKMRKGRQILNARSTYSPRPTKCHILGAPSSTVYRDGPSEGLSSVAILPDQLAFPSDKDLAGAKGRRKSLFQRSAILEALKTNCFGEKIKHEKFTVDDIHSLIPKNKDDQLPCLNDKIIDEYIAMLVKEACEKDGYVGTHEDSQNLRPYGAITCFWWPSRNVLSQNSGLLSSVNDLFMPVCDAGHWRLLVVSGKRKTISYFDSLCYQSKAFVDRVREWIKLTLGDMYNEGDWKTIEERRSPQQDNTVDCGVAVLLNARAIVMGLPLHPNLYSFEQNVMLTIRYELAVDLLSSNIDLEALPAAIQMETNSAGIDEIATTENENATKTIQSIHEPNPGKSVATIEHAVDTSDFRRNGSSYEEVDNNDSHGNRTYGGADEGENHPISTSLCGNEAQVKDNDELGRATAANPDLAGPTTTSEEENEEEVKLHERTPVPLTEDRLLLFGPSANEADENGGYDRENQYNVVELNPRSSLDRFTCSTPGPSAFDATESKLKMHGISLYNQNNGATQQSDVRDKVQILDGFTENKDYTTDFGDRETEKWLCDTISGENGILGSPPPMSKMTAKKNPTATGARSHASASACQRENSAIVQEKDPSLESDSLLASSGTDPTLHSEDKLITSFARTRATQPLQRLKSEKIMNLGKPSNLSCGLGRRLREYSSLRPICINPAELSLDSGKRDNAPEQQSTTFRSWAGAASARTRRGRNPFDGLDSHPVTPQLAWKDVDPPLKASSWKGVSRIGISQPAEIEEEDWEQMTPAERRRVWHVSCIQSETQGQRATNPCEQCKRRRDNSRKTSGLEECRVYKNNRVQQCAACINSRKSCSFVREGPSAEVACGETQLTAGAGRNTIDTPPISQPQPSPWNAVVWVTFPDNYPFHESTTLFIHNSPEDLRKLDRNAWLWFKEAPESGLGDSAVLRDEHGVCVHQGLVTMLAVQHGARFEESFSVRYHEWGWLKGQLQKLQKPQNDSLLSTSSDSHDGCDKLLLSDSDGQRQSTVIFIHATTHKPPEIQHVYEDVRMLRLTSGARIRVYPNMREWRQDQERIQDIQVLDEIAKSSGRLEYSYRPITCFGGPCTLQNCERTVLKRSHSEGERHVKIFDENYKDWEAICNLTCTYQPHRPERRSRKHKKENQKHQEERAAFGSRPHWFHQEYVSGLSHGEFRVSIRPKPNNEEDTRGWKGEVISLAWTSWNEKGELHIVKADENHFGGSPNSKCGALRKSDLKCFCLFVFEKLRARKSPCYESLEVGVRLDVGVADSQGQKRFFVNEITRWYNAHYFSYIILAKPWTKIYKAFAEAFRGYVQDGMPDMVD